MQQTATPANRDLEEILVQLVGQRNDKPIPGYGLMMEDLFFDQKSLILKIANLIKSHKVTFDSLVTELLIKHGATEQPVDGGGTYLHLPLAPKEYWDQYSPLADQICTISFDPIDWNQIKVLKSKNAYDFEKILKPFFENYV